MYYNSANNYNNYNNNSLNPNDSNTNNPSRGIRLPRYRQLDESTNQLSNQGNNQTIQSNQLTNNFTKNLNSQHDVNNHSSTLGKSNLSSIGMRSIAEDKTTPLSVSAEDLAPIKIPQLGRLQGVGSNLTNLNSVNSSFATTTATRDLLGIHSNHLLSNNLSNTISNNLSTNIPNNIPSNLSANPSSSYGRHRATSSNRQTHKKKKHTANSINNQSGNSLDQFMNQNQSNTHDTSSSSIYLPHIAPSNTLNASNSRVASSSAAKRQTNTGSPTNAQAANEMNYSNNNLFIGGASRSYDSYTSTSQYSEGYHFASVSTIKGNKPGNPNWINQDNYFICEDPTFLPNNSSNATNNYVSIYPFSYFCIVDGHGENGHLVSRKIQNTLPVYLKSGNLDIRRAFSQVQNELTSSTEFDSRCSGATCVLTVWNHKVNTLYVANCGDSRGIVARKVKNNSGQITFVPVSVTNDHKPDRPEERKRILAFGGHIGCRQVLVHQPGKGPVSMPVGPCRVWYQHRGETLGLAMSRSLGDVIVHRSGVTSDPEIIEHQVVDDDEFLIIATDGVWDVVDNQTAVQIVSNAISNFNAGASEKSLSLTKKYVEAANTLTRFARSRWEKMSPMIDDITCIVINLKRDR